MKYNKFSRRGIRYRKKITDVHGMTMAEMLIVVAIIAVLAGVSFIAVQNHQRSLGQLERDGLAKEIFVAAQNHLTVAFGEGYLGLSDDAFGTEDTISTDQYGSEIKDDYFFLVNGDISDATLLGQMLPFGSVDETVRTGGSYFIHYQKSTGLVLDVSYCSTSGTPSKYNCILQDTGDHTDYRTSVELRGMDQVKKRQRRNISDENHQGIDGGYIQGWYGAPEAKDLDPITLKAPSIKVVNAETLKVFVTDTNSTITDSYVLQLSFKGKISGGKKVYILNDDIRRDANRVQGTGTSTDPYVIVLDDITTAGKHFSEIEKDDGNDFIPGEDLLIEALAFSNDVFSNIANSGEHTTNSLFDSTDNSEEHGDIPDTAYIKNIRHLENLDYAISKLDNNDTTTPTTIGRPNGDLNIIAAVQTVDLDLERDNNGYWDDNKVVDLNNNSTENGYYYPISPMINSFSYYGEGHKISNIKANSEDAGLFSSSELITSISDLELIDFSISGIESAGTLAGSLTGTTVTNVIARNSNGRSSANVIADNSAGGLIASINDCTVQYSAASVIVGDESGSGSPDISGGLVGKTIGDSTIIGCYSGGHTRDGSYAEWVNITGNTYDVVGRTAGGLVGEAGDHTEINNSYSTCSVDGTTAGGFVGISSGSITNCYSTGLIKTDNAGAANVNSTKGAFAGNISGTLTNCQYYSIINEVKKNDTSSGSTTSVLDHYLGAVGDDVYANITALDDNVSSYEGFVGDPDNWEPARAYDQKLVKYYTGKYNLKTIKMLSPTTLDLPEEYKDDEGNNKWDDLFVSTHYGDWPAPEIFVINTRASGG